mmetsp:Transcript_42401/g.136907  ORF Transcript_42401/g.136907 Transcript_42401/m.136907 type:complete len:322 (+) Transcript_42401:155-1120(+)
MRHAPSRISSLKTRTGALRRAPCHSLLTRRTRSPLAPAKLPVTSRGGSPPPKATSQAACLSPRRSLSIVERRRRRLRLPVVEEHRCEHERHALQEGARGPRAVEDRRNNAREDDCDGGGVGLDDVVGVLDYGGDEQPAERSQPDDGPDGGREADEGARGGEGCPLEPKEDKEGLRDAEDGELHVAHPQRRLARLHLLLEVDVREAREQRRGEHRADAEQRPAGGRGARRGGDRVGRLDEPHAGAEQGEREPLQPPQRAAEVEDVEESRCQRLGLGPELVRGGGEVGDGDEEEHVLEAEQQRRKPHRERVPPPHHHPLPHVR